MISTDTTIEDFLASNEYSESTKDSYRRILKELIEFPRLDQMTPSGLVMFIKEHVKGDSQQYVSLCACRSFLSWHYGQIHPALKARIKRVKPKKQRSLTKDQIVELLAYFDTRTERGTRDLALAAVAIDTGLRASELARVKLADVNREHNSMQVIIKGGQWGTAVYSQETAFYIEAWLKFRKPADGVDALFLSLRKSKDYGKSLTRSGIQMIFKNWSKQIGFKFSPHDARRTFATISTLLGAPSKIVMVAGRWTNLEMVDEYTKNITENAILPYLPMAHIRPGMTTNE